MNQAFRTLLVEEHSRPIITVVNVLRTGTLDDPPGKEGLAYLTAEMLMRGAGAWNQAQLADEIEFLGSSLSVNVGRWTTTVTGDALTRHFDSFERIVRRVLEEPRFDDSEFQQLKRQTAADIVHVRENDSMLCQRFLVKQLYGSHAYGRPRKGTQESLDSITLDDVRAFYTKHYTRQESLTAAAGDLDQERLLRFAEKTLGHLKSSERARDAVAPVTNAMGIEAVLVDKPDRSQIPVMMGHSTIHANHEDYVPLFVGNVVFGGTFTARLSQEIREKRGWSYGAYSSIHADQHLGSFLMRFSPSVKDTLPAIQLARTMLEDFAKNGVNETELESAKNYLCNSHSFVIDTSVKRLYEMIHQDLTGRPTDWLNTYIERVSRLNLAEVNAAVQRHIDPSNLTLAVVATAEEFADKLQSWDDVRALKKVDYRSD